MSNYRLYLKANPSRVKSPSIDLARAEARISAARKVKSYLKILFSVPFVVCGVYLGSLLYNHVRVIPTGVETVQDFYKRYQSPPRVDIFQVSGRTYYRVTGEIPAPLGFPKGNPVYIFDNSGRLIDWTGESLNDPNFSARWDGTPSQSMSVGYFLERFPPS